MKSILPRYLVPLTRYHVLSLTTSFKSMNIDCFCCSFSCIEFNNSVKVAWVVSSITMAKLEFLTLHHSFALLNVFVSLESGIVKHLSPTQLSKYEATGPKNAVIAKYCTVRYMFGYLSQEHESHVRATANVGIQ